MLLGFGGVSAAGAAGPVDLGGPKQRAVLALLMIEPGSVVSLDRIVDRVWSDPPARAEVSVRGYVSNLRKSLVAVGLGSHAIEFHDRGYLLRVDRRRSISIVSIARSRTPVASRRSATSSPPASAWCTPSTSTSARRSGRSPRISDWPT